MAHVRHADIRVRSHTTCQHQHQQEQQQEQQSAASNRRHVGLAALAAVMAVQLPSPAQAATTAAGDWSSPGLSVPEDPNVPRFVKTASGIRIQELAMGKGPIPAIGDTVLIDFVLRRANGYFIYSTVEGVSFQPKDVPVGPVAFTLGQDASWIQGLQEVVGRMHQGSKLRALIPANLGYQDCGKDQPQPPTFATQRQLTNHCKEPLLFEVALLRVTAASKGKL